MGSIKNAIKIINDQIKDLNIRKESIQSRCPHVKVVKSEYMWRVGATMYVDVCKECGAVLENYLK